MHCIADDLFNKHQQGEAENARDGLKKIKITIQQMYSVFEQCE